MILGAIVGIFGLGMFCLVWCGGLIVLLMGEGGEDKSYTSTKHHDVVCPLHLQSRNSIYRSQCSDRAILWGAPCQQLRMEHDVAKLPSFQQQCFWEVVRI